MTRGFHFTFADTQLTLLPSGALWWAERALLCVSDLHLGKSERIVRRSGDMLPPYETRDTLGRLEEDLRHTNASTVVCLGDSFDDLLAAQNLPEDEMLWITRLMAGRYWIWIEGNHDPSPVEFGGTHLAELHEAPLTFRHIAQESVSGEISGHYHPKARLKLRGGGVSRPCMLVDANRVILPAYGTYTGGLRSDDTALTRLMREDAIAVLTGTPPRPIPMPR